jgi:hypothetical protein
MKRESGGIQYNILQLCRLFLVRVKVEIVKFLLWLEPSSTPINSQHAPTSSLPSSLCHCGLRALSALPIRGTQAWLHGRLPHCDGITPSPKPHAVLTSPSSAQHLHTRPQPRPNGNDSHRLANRDIDRLILQ